jgi:hypothetical protein
MKEGEGREAGMLIKGENGKCGEMSWGCQRRDGTSRGSQTCEKGQDP